MKAFLSFLLCIIFLPNLVSASSVDVGIEERIDGTISVFQKSHEILEVTPEIYNSGSAPVLSRIRIDIRNESGNIFTAWGSESLLLPGERRSSEIYWFLPAYSGKYTIRARGYYGHETLEKETDVNVTFGRSSDAFTISAIAFSDSIAVSVTSQENVGASVIYVKDVPPGWIIEQRKMAVSKGVTNAFLHYEPVSFHERDVTISALSLDGKFYSEKRVTLRRGVMEKIAEILLFPLRLFL